METEIKNQINSKRKTSIRVLPFILFTILLFSTQATFAHCDSYDGPVIKDAFKAFETNNVNLVLKWVSENHEKEITTLFNKTNNLKNGDKAIYEIVEKHFLETLVRLHRETEGAPYTGLKPAGSTAKIVQMSDEALTAGSVDNLMSKFTAHIEMVVREKYDKVSALSKVKNESLKNGRAYVAAYVEYTHTLEGIHSIIENDGSAHSHNH